MKHAISAKMISNPNYAWHHYPCHIQGYMSNLFIVKVEILLSDHKVSPPRIIIHYHDVD